MIVKPSGWDWKEEGEVVLGTLPDALASELISALEWLAADPG